MSVLKNEKRKNDASRGIPGWLLLIVGFVLGGIVTFAAIHPTPQPANSGSMLDPTYDSILLTATYVVEQATVTAQAMIVPVNQPDIDPLEITATYIVGQATQAAAQSSLPNP